MITIAENIVCIRANNPSPMTLDGTNCYIVSAGSDAVLIDVGPDEPAHLDALAHYVRAHRLMRERQIVEQLQSGAKSVDELVKQIYKDVDPKLHGAAAWSVSAHLKR